VGVTAGPAGPRRNHLIASLPDALYQRLSSHLQAVPLARGQVVHKSNCPIAHIYFPTEGIVSLLYVTREGTSAETAVVGREGLIGLSALLGTELPANDAVVQCEGAAVRIPARILHSEFARGGPLQAAVLRFVMALITQMGQTAVCNRHHSLEQQLCRWLLLSVDRLGNTELNMTQMMIASMLGVRREGVTEAAGRLQAQGAIRYTRGRINVVDRAQLEQLVCECYGVLRRDTERLLAPLAPPAFGVRFG